MITLLEKHKTNNAVVKPLTFKQFTLENLAIITFIIRPKGPTQFTVSSGT